MTKRNVMRVIDTLFWLAIALFPLVVYALQSINATQVISFESFLTNLGFGLNTSSPIYITLNTIFGVGGGLLELTSNTGILLYATYFITIMLLHFIIDMLLVIVRWGHHLLDKATKE